jgi:nucleoside-diphosphate-sugar epimerase
MKPEDTPKDFVFNESHWSNPWGDHLNHYAKSKTLAEMVAWQEQAKIPKEEQTEICVINPGMIMGPAFVGAGFTSGEIIADTMNGKYPGVPRFSCPVVDVRDCARGHLQAIKVKEAAN